MRVNVKVKVVGRGEKKRANVYTCTEFNFDLLFFWYYN